MNWSGAEYLQNQGGLQELQNQQEQEAIDQHRKNKLGVQITSGIGSTLKGAVGGGLKGAILGTLIAPGVGTVAGATLGAGSGALSGSGVMSGQEQKSVATNAAMMALSQGMGAGAEGAAGNAAGPRPTDYQDYANASDPNFTGPAYMQPQGATQLPWWKRFGGTQ